MPTFDSQEHNRLINTILPIINGAKNRRISIENEWLSSYKTWQGWPSQSYILPLADNAIHYYIPHVRRAIEKNVKRVTKLLLSNITRFQVLPSDSEVSHDRAESVQTVLDLCLKQKIKLRRNISQLARVAYLYDFPILNTSVTITNNEVWPYQKVVDPYSFYIYPDTAMDLEEATLLFEESIIPFEVYKSFTDKDDKKSLYSTLKVDELHLPVWPYHLVERIAYRGLTLPNDLITTDSTTRYKVTEAEVESARDKTKKELSAQSRAFVHLMKCYFRLGSSWFHTIICMNTETPRIVRLDDDEHTPLYRWTNTRSLPGELYTNSESDDMRVLQNLANNSLSQMESDRSIYANPPIGVDATYVSRMQEYTFGNRKFWRVEGNPKDIFMPIQVNDNSAESIKATQIYMQLIDNHSGGQLAEGTPGRNMPRAGFAAQSMLDMATIEVADMASFLEDEILTPSLRDIYYNIVKYVPNSQVFKIPNKRPDLVKSYKKKDLYGEYDFTWLGSLSFQDSQARADKFINFLTLILQPQILPLLSQELQQKGLMLDISSLIQNIYSFGLGERGLSDIITPITQEVLQAREQSQQPDPRMIQAMIKAQEAKNKMELNKIKGITSIQTHRTKLQGEQLDNQGKLLDIQSKSQDMRIKQAQFIKSMLESSEDEDENYG